MTQILKMVAVASGVDGDALWLVGLWALHFDFQNPVFKARLHVIWINAERQFNTAREAASTTLSTMPSCVVVFDRQFAFDCQRVVTYGDVYGVVCKAREFRGHQQCVVFCVNINGGKPAPEVVA